MNEDSSFSVVTWNCLADSYSHSHGLCDTTANATSANKSLAHKATSWSHRCHLIDAILTRRNADIVCLQEVDHFDDHFKQFFSEKSYHTEYVQRTSRKDGVLIAFKRHKFSLMQKHVIQFDDLADFDPSILHPLKRSSFRRNNVALVLILRATNRDETARTLTVATAHLYWNPLFSHIKLAQTVYLLQRIAHIRSLLGDESICASILTGDFNSEPASLQHAAILRGCAFSPIEHTSVTMAARIAVTHVVNRERRLRHIVPMGTADGASDQEVRFFCDATLSKLARWLRLVGVNTAVENKASQEQRASMNDFAPLFDLVRRERRILVTTSINIIKRNTCPETFFVRTPSSIAELKKSLAALLNHYSVKLKPENFLSICGKCGGRINASTADNQHINAKFVPQDRQLFACEDCHQVYWWSDSVSGCSSKARRLAHSLHAYVESQKKRTGRRIAETEQVKPGDPFRDIPVCRQEWLRFHSAFQQVHGREPDCTNINGNYRGTLDYIFIGGALSAKYAQTECFEPEVEAPVLHGDFPNLNWPSDHMLVRADVVLKGKRPLGRSFFARSLSDVR